MIRVSVSVSVRIRVRTRVRTRALCQLYIGNSEVRLCPALELWFGLGLRLRYGLSSNRTWMVASMVKID